MGCHIPWRAQNFAHKISIRKTNASIRAHTPTNSSLNFTPKAKIWQYALVKVWNNYTNFGLEDGVWVVSNASPSLSSKKLQELVRKLKFKNSRSFSKFRYRPWEMVFWGARQENEEMRRISYLGALKLNKKWEIWKIFCEVSWRGQ